MAKFIIEVSDGYIRERADAGNIQRQAEQKDMNPLRLFADLLAFSYLENQLDSGNNEWTISAEDFSGDIQKRKTFNDIMTTVAGLVILKK